MATNDLDLQWKIDDRDPEGGWTVTDLGPNDRIVTGVTYVNDLGVKAVLRYHHPAPGYAIYGGIWSVEFYAPYFADVHMATLTENRDRARCERSLRRLLNRRTFPPPVN
jgi:hypothetical protein